MADGEDRKKLIKYLPSFIQKFSEIKQIMHVGDIEIEQLYQNIQQILDDAFIKTCSRKGIQKYERMLGIVPDVEDNLELRKLRVLMHWNNYLPYTLSTLIKKLIMYCGEDGFRISEEGLTSYHLVVDVFSSRWEQIEELKEIIGRIIPMNMYFILNSILKEDANMDLYHAGVPCISECITIPAVEEV